MKALLDELDYHHKGRLKARRKLFKFIRENEGRIESGWLLRKIRFNYLGDLSDNNIVYYTRQIMQTEGKNEKESVNSRLPIM